MNTDVTARHAAPRNGGRRAAVVLALAGVVAGPLLIVSGLRGGVPEAAPLPSTTFDIAPNAAARGVTGVANGTGASSAPAVRQGPLRLVVPQLGVDAAIEDRPVTGGGDLVIPGDLSVVGRWDKGAPLDSRAGTTLLAGHVDVNGDLGALHELASIRAGAEIRTSDESGGVTRWAVTGLDVRHKENLPVFSASGERRLVLVTCGGPVLRAGDGWTYRDNVIVTAVPVDAGNAGKAGNAGDAGDTGGTGDAQGS